MTVGTGIDDDEWEDVPDETRYAASSNPRRAAKPPSVRSRRSAGTSTPTRQRRSAAANLRSVRGRAGTSNETSPVRTPTREPIVLEEFVNEKPRTSSAALPPRHADVNRSDDTTNGEPTDWLVEVQDIARLILRTLFSVFKDTIRWIRGPLPFIIFIFVYLAIAAVVFRSLKIFFAPVCNTPVLGTLVCGPFQVAFGSNRKSSKGGRKDVMRADYPKLMEMQEKSFSQLLDEAVIGPGLSLQIKKAELASSDVRTRIRHSQLAGKDDLVKALNGFQIDARRTGHALSRLSAKIGGSVDDIRAMNEYTLRTLGSVQAVSKSSWPIRRAGTLVQLRESFTQSMNAQAGILGKLILATQLVLHDLDALETRLETLQGIIHREDLTVQEDTRELKSSWLVRFGHHKREIRTQDDLALLLRSVSAYRNRALAHVSGALTTLHGLNGQVEDLRERVAEPALLEGEGELPLEVQIDSIRRSIERLEDTQKAAKLKQEDAVQQIMGPDSGFVQEVRRGFE